MKHIRWVALALMIGVFAVAGVWASLTFTNTPAETTDADTPSSDNQTSSNATLGTPTQPANNTDVSPQEDTHSTDNNTGPGPRVNSGNSSDDSNESNNTNNGTMKSKSQLVEVPGKPTKMCRRFW